MFCRKCGTQLPDDAAFCSNCGEKTNVSGTIEPNANATNTNVSSGINNNKRNLIIVAIVSAIVACCAFFYVNYNSSFVPDFVSKDLKFTWNDDLDSISKKYPQWMFKKKELQYIVEPSIPDIAGLKVEDTKLNLTKDKKLKRMFISFDLNLPPKPHLFNPLTGKVYPRHVLDEAYTRYHILSPIVNKRVKEDVDKLYRVMASYYGNNPKHSTRKYDYNSSTIDEWIWNKDDTKISLYFEHPKDNYTSYNYLYISIENTKYY